MWVFISMTLNAPNWGLATRWGLAIRTIVLPAAPLTGLLIALLLAGLLRWSLVFPWGLLAVPWLSYEGAWLIVTNMNPVLAGWVPTGNLMAGVGELLLVLLLVSGSVLWWKRR